MFFLKISLAFFLLRIVTQPWQRWTIYGSTAIYFLWAVAFLFLTIFQCGLPNSWAQKIATGQCVSYSVTLPTNYVYAGLNIATDLMFCLIPMFILRTSKMLLRRKIPVYCLLTLGWLGSISSMVRTAYLHDLSPGGNFFNKASNLIIWVNILEMIKSSTLFGLEH